MAVNLEQDNYERVRAAWTAMDQTYSTLQPGDSLHAVDNSGQGQLQPFAVPSGWKVFDVKETSQAGGLQVAIYKNSNTGDVMVVPMGTNGFGSVAQCHEGQTP
jgi:hypothetical protein